MTSISSFGVTPITTHCWSGNGTNLAMSHNNKEVKLYKPGNLPNKWEETATLDQHDLRVTGIDWAPKTNRIVTCSADRNAYVWNLEANGTWRHTLVLLRINRAATCVKWSPEENKFAVGSGARLISVCYFEQENDWWVAKHIKKPIKSTVTALDWHPNNCLIAAGSTGFKVRVFSGYVKDIEDKPSSTPWGSKMPFANLMAEFSNSLNGGGWVHAVSFSADGNKLAWVGHDSSISVADATKGMAIFKLKTSHLPLLTCIWVSPTTLIAAGHDCTPLVFQVEPSGQVSFKTKLEDDKKSEASAKFSAKGFFQNKDRTGMSEVADTVLNTTHQNQISCIQIRSGSKNSADKISTSAGDGKIVIWDLRSLEKQIQGLKI
jgi:actin related protein 2/3 complex subunit 1A/1B